MAARRRKHRRPVARIGQTAGFCASGKLRYPDALEAERALATAAMAGALGDPTRKETRSYECPVCLGHHLTSQPHAPRPASVVIAA